MTDDNEKILQVIGSVKKLALKQIIDKVNNGAPLSPGELKTLNDLEAEIKGAGAEEEPEEDSTDAKSEFANPLEISRYLENTGWKVRKSTVYNHIKGAKLRPDLPQGRYSLKAVLRYARTFLVTQETKQKLVDEDIARRKARKEVEKLDEEIKQRRIKRLADEGNYIPRKDFELELAARAAVLEAGVTQMIHTDAGRFISLVEGNINRMGDFIRELREGFDRVLNDFASEREFHVLFDQAPALPPSAMPPGKEN